jgi:hypothetical protein
VLPWWGWVLLWVVLLLASGAYLVRCGRAVWGSLRRLGKEVERAGAMVAALEQRTEELRDLERPAAAVTRPVAEVRAQYRRQRATAAQERRARRARRLPSWARVD